MTASSAVFKIEVSSLVLPLHHDWEVGARALYTPNPAPLRLLSCLLFIQHIFEGPTKSQALFLELVMDQPGEDPCLHWVHLVSTDDAM